jgi:hypothetical protein
MRTGESRCAGLPRGMCVPQSKETHKCLQGFELPENCRIDCGTRLSLQKMLQKMGAVGTSDALTPLTRNRNS